MSADITDVARIQDEDVLRRMWQDTSDFGRKKEIRTHMYKLREARLKDFYNSSEGNTVIERTTMTSTSDSAKPDLSTTHADNLADQSYVTLKSKEVRDSESPTRDSYNKTIAKHQDQGWTVTSSNERSQDGKTHTSKHVASTSGTQPIDGGKVDYSAKLEDKASVFQDGDDRNFTKAVEASSSSTIRQEASGGDENSNFRSSTTKTSSSSRYASESKNTDEYSQALPSSTTTTITRDQIPYSSINEDNVRSVTEKSYTTKVPNELKNHPIYVEGKTKVTQETKTLGDGTIVTTTRYETKQGNSTQTATHKKYSNIASKQAEQRSSSSSTHVQSRRNQDIQSSSNITRDSRNTGRDDQKAIEYIVTPGSTVDINVATVKNNTDTHRQRYQDVKDTQQRESVTSQHSTKVVRESTHNEQVNRQSDVDVRNDQRVKETVDYVVIPETVNQNVTTTRTTVTKTTAPEHTTRDQRIAPEKVEYVDIVPVVVDENVTTRTTTTKTVISEQPREQIDYNTTSRIVEQNQNVRDCKKIVNDQFISTEQQHEVDTRKHVTRSEPREARPSAPREPRAEEPYPQPQRILETPLTTQEPYSQPERRQPIRPGKSELDQKPQPTEGHYDTTYRTEFTNKKISVEVSPTHDAFARSLRSVTPERIVRGSPRTGSNTSLRSNTSPEKTLYPSRTSPDRRDRSHSPRKSTDRTLSTETITYKTNKTSPLRKTPDRPITNQRFINGDVNVNKTTQHYSTDTITRKSKTTKDQTVTDTIDSSTLTRRKNKPRSPSPTGTTTSDFEYVGNTKDVTSNLDIDYTLTTSHKNTTRKDTSRPSSLDITTKKVTERTQTSPIKDSPKKAKSPTKDVTQDKPKLVRTDTYEERVKQILGLTADTKETRRNSLEKRRSSLERNSLKRSSLRETTTRTTSSDDIIRKNSKTAAITDSLRKSPEKQPVRAYPERKSPSKTSTTVLEITSQIRKSPEKQPLKPSVDKKSPVPKVSEFPSQSRKSPEKQSFQPSLNKKSPNKTGPTVSEFPSQVRRSPERKSLEPYPEKKSPNKTGSTVSEFPSQIRRSPDREPLEPYPERRSPNKNSPSVSEFPSQIRRSPEREPLEPYPERRSPSRSGPAVSEFPSQIRRSPEREPLEPYPERRSPSKIGPSVSEFPSQIRRSPEREPLEPYPERRSPSKIGPSVSEFPSQIRRSPEREPLEPYPERRPPSKSGPSVSEFPSQIRRSPEREPLEPYPERKSPSKAGPSVSEFPSQIRRSPEREPLEPYPERKSPSKAGPSVSEFPSQIRRSPEREPLEPYPESRSPSKSGPSVSEFPTQIRRSPEKEILQPYPEKKSPTKTGPFICQLPSQTRRSPEKEPLEPYSEKRPTKTGPDVSEFPSQIRRSPEKELLKTYPDKKSPTKVGPAVSEFPSQTRDSPERKLVKPYKEKKSPTKTGPSKKSKKPRTFSESSTTTEEEEEQQIEESMTQTTRETVESRIPVSEPIAEKKLFSQLCQKDEVRKLDKKKTTQELLEAEIFQNQITDQRTVKKDKPLPNGTLPKETSKRTNTKKTFTTSDSVRTGTSKDIIRTTSVKTENIREKTPTKRVSEKITKKESPKTIYTTRTPTQRKQPETIYRVEKTKFIGETEYQDEFSKVNKNKKEPIRKPLKPTGKVSLFDIENVENIKHDTSVHLRTNRVDDTVTKKKVSKLVMVNGDTTKPKPKVLPIRQPSPIKKVNVTNKPVDKVIDSKSKITSTAQSRFSTTTKKTIIQTDNKSKATKPTEPKKHVVTATITVSPKTGPKTKPAAKTPSKTATKAPTRRPTDIVKKVSNGYESSDTDEDSIVESIEGSFIDLTENSQFSRTSTDQTVTRTPKEQTRQHVITTKTVLITNENAPDREVIVNLQRSKSSREPTPDRLCPRPLTSDEEEDSSPIRYPDQISEPDDGGLRRKPKKLSDIPIFESEDSGDYTRITEVTDTKKRISKVDMVEETDESLLSIDKKINKFLNTADQLTKEPLKPKPAKVGRPTLEFPEDLREDECLLSVSDKVSKFINTSDDVTISDTSVSSKPKAYQEGVNINIQKKLTQFKSSVEEANKPKKVDQGPAPKVSRPDLSNVEDNLREDECLLSVSDKVSKFISTAEKLTSTTSTKPVSLSKIEVKPISSKPDRSSPIKDISLKSDRKSPVKDVAADFIKTERKEEIITRKSPSLSPERRRSPSPEFKTPIKRPSNQYSNILKTDATETIYNTEDTDFNTKSSRNLSQEDSKTILSSTTRLRSTDSIKRAKALFENTKNDDEVPKQRDILSRPSVFDKKRNQTKTTVDVDEREDVTSRRSSSQRSTDNCLKSTRLVETITRRSQSPQKSPERPRSPDKVEITRFRASSPEKIPDIVTSRPRSREPTPDGDIPHYMKPLDRSLRPNSPHRDSINQTKPQLSEPLNQEDTRQTKFGVTLRRTDSGRISRTQESTAVTSERRKSSITLEKRITEEEIEELFEIEVLEELLEKIVGYELRRKIRTQIRLVRKLISEGTLDEYVAKRKSIPRESNTRRGTSPNKTTKPEELNRTTEYQTSYIRKVSPERKTADKKMFEHTSTIDRKSSIETATEYQSSYSFNERRSSTECSKLSRKSISPVRDAKSPVRDAKSPLRLSPERKVTKKVDVTPSGKVTTVKTTETIPGGLRTTTTKTSESKTFTTLKKAVPTTKKLVEDTQPEWVRQRNLRNAKDSSIQTTRKVSTATSSVTTKKSTIRSSPAKEVKPTDIITSSYGVGPTDENGAPLFGLKALRAQNKNEKTKVQGTVIRSQYYSENDQEPVGQVSVTKYSTDPRDLEQDGVVSTDGKMTSVTTTQKFGYKDTPSLRSLSDKKKAICDTTEKTTTKTTKLNRRGSVKEMSKKFIDNAVETLKSERQTTYPKAGLILRTSSFKSTNGESPSRETSPELESSTVTVRTMKSSTSGETFLSNKNKISGVQDVITRMKNEERVEGDSEEDIAARGLLNKFLGAQVILSGMEERSSSASSKTTESTSPTGTVRRSTKVTSTVTEGGRPTTTERVFQRPVSEKEIETVWDEQTLRLLLEQSTDYEERRIIRVRLRQVMAEQEACTALVDEATKSEGSTTPTTPTIPGQLEGESQLLPLLQGLLAAPENDITPDSGTESGEDQRSSLIAEVQCALEKLSNSLNSDQTDITPERRCSLLQLVTKLQAGLSGSNASERRSSTTSSKGGRFQKRKNKQARHTVGVSKEELADARKLIEEISLNELTPSGSTTKVHLSKQNSESSVPTSSASSSYRNIHQAKVKNTTPKPFSSSNSTTSSVQTPTEHFDGFDLLFNEDKEMICHEAAPVQQKATPTYAATVKQTHPNLERNTSVESSASIKSAYKAVQQAAALKREQSRDNKDEESQSEEEDESSTVKGASDLENASLKSNPIYSKPSNIITKNDEKSSRFDTQKKLRMKRANTIDIPKPINFYEDEDDSDSDHDDSAQKRRDSYYALRGPINVSNPSTKKIVPSFEPKTDSDKKFLAFINNHNEKSANKGSVWANNSSVWGNRFGNIKNNFEKPTTNDAKSFWKSADDTVTRSSNNQFGPKISRRSARNLQQMFEEKQKEGLNITPNSKQPYVNTGHTKTHINTGHQQSNVVTGSLQVKTAPERNYKVVPQPLPVNQFSHAPQSAFKPIQKPPQSIPKRTSMVFSPEGGEILKSEIKSTNGSAFLYSPKPLSSPETSAVTSPVASKPWAANVGGSRVHSLAASKFERPPPQDPPKPRKLSKDVVPKVFIPANQVNSNVIDRAPAYLGKGANTQSSTVRKLSGQYENGDNHTNNYQQQIQSKPQSYQIRTSVVESQYTPPVKHYEPKVRAQIESGPISPPQNYTIRYDQPQNVYAQQQTPTAQPPNYTVRYDNANSHPQQAQNYTVRYDQPQIQQPNQNQYYPQQTYKNNYDQSRTQHSYPQQVPQQYPLQNHSMKYDRQPQHPSHPPQNYSIRYDQPVINAQQPLSPQYKPQTYREQQPQHQPNSPQNYSIRYDQPRTNIQQPLSPQYKPQNYTDNQSQHQPHSPQNYSVSVTNVQQPQSPQYKPQNYSVRYDQPETPPIVSPNQIYQHIPGKESQQVPLVSPQNISEQEKEYTSTLEFKPTQTKVPVQAIEPVVQPPKIQRQLSEESLHEHTAVSSRVMSGPVSQQAVTVRQKSPMNRDQHDMDAAFSLKTSLQKATTKQDSNLEVNTNKPNEVKSPARSPARSPSNSFSYKPREPTAVSPTLSQSFKQKTGLPTFDPVKYKPSDCPKPTVAPSSFKFKSTFENTHKEAKSCIVKPMQQQKSAAIYNNTSNTARPKEKLKINDKGQSIVTGQFHIPLINVKSPESPRPPAHAQVLSKSDSWHEICLAHQTTTQKPAPAPGPVKSKSSHSLAVPKMFEAGMSKDEMLQKRKTMEAFLTGTKSSQNEAGAKTVKRSINRIKTSQKMSTQKRVTGGLSRSRTLPDIICPELLDESNVDEAFDELFETA